MILVALLRAGRGLKFLRCYLLPRLYRRRPASCRAWIEIHAVLSSSKNMLVALLRAGRGLKSHGSSRVPC